MSYTGEKETSDCEDEMIIHYFLYIKRGWFSNDKRYLCNGACGTTKEKRTRDKKKVTCKNCLRELKRR